jgi:superfamily II DNA helicase RecQ
MIKFNPDYLPPHYDDLSIKSGSLPSYDETITFSKYQIPEKCDDIPSSSIKSNFKSTKSTKHSKLIDKLYTMGQKSYIIIDMSKVNFKELLLEIAKNHSSLAVYQFVTNEKNDSRRSVFQFFTTDKLIFKPISISIKINDSVVKITDKMIIIGFKNIVIEYENSFNSKKNNSKKNNSKKNNSKKNNSKKNNSKKNNEDTTSRMFQINNKHDVRAVLFNFQMIGDEHIQTITNYRACYHNK